MTVVEYRVGDVVRDAWGDLWARTGQGDWICLWEHHGTEDAIGARRVALTEPLTVISSDVVIVPTAKMDAQPGSLWRGLCRRCEYDTGVAAAGAAGRRLVDHRRDKHDNKLA